MTRTRTRRGLRPPAGASRTEDIVGRARVDLGDVEALELFADARVGSVVEPSLVLDPFGIAEAGRRPDPGDLLEAQPSGVDARGTLERYPTPDGEGLVPVLRVGDLAMLVLGTEPYPTGARLEVEGFLYAFSIAWDRFHGLRVRGARRRWRVAGIDRRDVDGTAPPLSSIVRTPVDRVPGRDALDEQSFVELHLRRP